MKKVIVIPHTHWDREWYFTEKKFKDRLVRVLDNVLEHLEKYPEFTFQMDGQAAPVMDYLTRRPENKGKIKKFVDEKRLFIGPSFVLPDEYLSSGEALIRNIEYGIEKAKELGDCYKVGYFPDTFGHIGQLPQILRQFGLDNICFWRGLPSDIPEQRDLTWIGSDGSVLTGYHCDRTFNIGYGNCWELKKTDSKFVVLQGGEVKDMDEVIDSELSRSSTDTIVFMNGSDHRDVQEGIVEIVRELNERYDDAEFAFGSFEDYFDEVSKAHNISQIIKGELNKGTETTFLLNGTFSARVREVKQPYAECNLKLLRAEFAQTIAHELTGARYEKEALEEAWEYLLLNMPHDSICGCSADRVHEDMAYRFNQAKDIAEKLTDNSANTIADEADTVFIGEESLAFVVLNDSGFEREAFRTRIEIPGDFGDFEVYDNGGNGLDYHVLSKEEKNNITEKVFKGRSDLKFPQLSSIELIVKGNVPPLGHATFELRKASKKKKQEKEDLKRALENEHMLVGVNLNGTLNIKDLKTGEIYPNCNLFSDVADRGDEYTFSHIEDDFPVSQGIKTKIKAVYDNEVGTCVRIEYDMKLPKGLAKGRKKRMDKEVKCRLVSYVTLLKGSKKLDIVTEFDNKARNHRLRAVFPTYLKSDHSYAAGQFEVVEREAKEGDSSLEGRVEVESNSYCNHGFFAMWDGKKGIGVVSKGLPEYEVVRSEDGKVDGELTLVRSVGHLSRDDLLTRKGLAGPPAETPNAQQLGSHKFEYSIVLLNDEHWVEELYKARDGIESLDSAVTGKHEGPLDNKASFISIPSGLQYSSLRMKDGKALLRMYNPTSSIVILENDAFMSMSEIGLDGEERSFWRRSLGPRKFFTFIVS